MTMQSAIGQGGALPMWKAALIGALVFALACLMFWATAAARALPVGSPAFIRSFSPVAGIGQLVGGLFWTALLGAVLASLAAGAWNAARRRRHA